MVTSCKYGNMLYDNEYLFQCQHGNLPFLKLMKMVKIGSLGMGCSIASYLTTIITNFHIEFHLLVDQHKTT